MRKIILEQFSLFVLYRRVAYCTNCVNVLVLCDERKFRFRMKR
jgi:hypothetical protein